MSTRILLTLSFLTFAATATVHAAGDSSLCQAAKLRAAAKYAACTLKAEARAELSGKTMKTARCVARFGEACTLAETTYGDACPTLGDCAEYRNAASCAAETLPLPTTTTTSTSTTIAPAGECPTDGRYDACLTYDQHPACKGCCNQAAGGACEAACSEALEQGACANTAMNAACAAAVNAAECAVACDCY